MEVCVTGRQGGAELGGGLVHKAAFMSHTSPSLGVLSTQCFRSSLEAHTELMKALCSSFIAGKRSRLKAAATGSGAQGRAQKVPKAECPVVLPL